MGHILGQLIEIVYHLLDSIRRHLDVVATPSICHAKSTIVEHHWRFLKIIIEDHWRLLKSRSPQQAAPRREGLGWESATTSHDPDEVFHWSRAMSEHPPLAVKPWRHQGQPASPGAGTRLDNAGPAKRGAVEAFKLNISSGGTSWQPTKDESCSEWIGEHDGACYKAWHRVAHSWFLTFVQQPIPTIDVS